MWGNVMGVTRVAAVIPPQQLNMVAPKVVNLCWNGTRSRKSGSMFYKWNALQICYARVTAQ